MASIIFELDKDKYDNPSMNTKARFLQYMAGVSHQFIQPMRFCTGSWEGEQADSYAVEAMDYSRHVLPVGWCDKQTSVLYVSADMSRAKEVSYEGKLIPGRTKPMKFEMHGRTVPTDVPGWTMFHDTGLFWVAR